ncbi:MAG: hypothetical protein H6Q68_465 [Firmicutes bacterium]|nr:hypothetical protein [Bacillota bacterium]
MKSIVKKIAILSMVGMMQIGCDASVIEASPIHSDQAPIQQLDDRHEAERIENERHERAMERRPNESEYEWEERQKRENERHERNLWRIAHAIFN